MQYLLRELQEKVQENFDRYKKTQKKVSIAWQTFTESLETWLLYSPLLEEENIEVIVQDIKSSVIKKIEEDSVQNVVELVGKIARNKVMEYRLRRGQSFDPQLADKLPSKIPEGVSAGELSDSCMKKLSPISRILISLRLRKVKKIDMAKMLFVTPGQITNYFKKAEDEIIKKCRDSHDKLS